MCVTKFECDAGIQYQLIQARTSMKTSILLSGAAIAVFLDVASGASSSAWLVPSMRIGAVRMVTSKAETCATKELVNASSFAYSMEVAHCYMSVASVRRILVAVNCCIFAFRAI